MQGREEKQLHPALPQQIMVNQTDRWKEVHSDHAPILLTMPFTENNDTNFSQINMISWNVLADDQNNALAKGSADSCGESDTQQELRHSKILQALAKMEENNPPIHLIALQEAGDKKLL